MDAEVVENTKGVHLWWRDKIITKDGDYKGVATEVKVATFAS
jgi:hypothetical protein